MLWAQRSYLLTLEELFQSHERAESIVPLFVTGGLGMFYGYKQYNIHVLPNEIHVLEYNGLDDYESYTISNMTPVRKL